ncbi:MAG: hypothetical protein AAF364_09265 [Pseudomonadota bacterium]
MAQTFWTGSNLSFTNGSKIVTVNTGPSVDSIYPNSKLKSVNYNEPVEVKTAYGSTIELYENWPGSTANTSATVTPSSAAAAAAGVAAQQVVTEIQNLVGSASATATANSFVKRDSNGRIKAATPSANDDVVTKGYFQTGSALSAAGIFHEGNSVNPLDYGLGTSAKFISFNDWDDLLSYDTGFYSTYQNNSTAIPNSPPFFSNSAINTLVEVKREGARSVVVVYETKIGNISKFERVHSGTVWGDWHEYYHSGNTNFNEFGGVGSDDRIGMGVVASSTTARFYLPINSENAPTSVSIVGSFKVIKEGVSTVATGVSPVLNATSSNKVAVLDVTGLSGLTVGENVQLATDTSTSKISVNS